MTKFSNNIAYLYGSIALFIFSSILGIARQKNDRFIPALLIFFLIVGNLHTLQTMHPPIDPSHINNLVSQKTLLTLAGTVTGLVTFDGNKSRFEVELHEIIYRKQPDDNSPVPASGKIRLSVRGQRPVPLVPGQEILAVATVNRINNYQTPGTFDYKGYMQHMGIFVSGWISSPQYIEQVANSTTMLTGLRLFAQQIRQKIRHFLQEHCDPVAGGLYQALIIGDRSGVPNQILEHFSLTGCMHLLAISGLHMSLLTFLLYGLLVSIMKQSQWMLLRFHVPTLAMALCFPVLFLYAFIAGMNIPVIRSLIMASILLFAVLVRRQQSILNLIAAAALLVLILNPSSLFTVSFQLSFTAILAIGIIYPKLSSFWSQESLGEKQNRILVLVRWPIAALLISLAAQAGTLPLLLYHFNRFSPISPLMNLLIEPLLCFVALPLGLLAVPLIPLSPETAAYLFNLGGAALHAADVMTTRVASFSYASFWTITPTILEVLLYFLLLLLLVTSRSRSISFGAGLGFLLLFIHFTSDLYLPVKKNSAEVSYLDVGQGTATLLELPDGTTILIDGGGGFSERFNVGKNIIAPYLWKKRIWDIDKVVITHPDSDHYNGLDFIIKHFKPLITYTNGQPVQSGRYKELLKLIDRYGIEQQHPKVGTILHRDSLCRLICFGMPGIASTMDTDNNKSLVLKLECGKTSFLFPGDIEEKAESLLVDQGPPLQADVLLSPHHGSKTSNSTAFLKAVNPRFIVISASRTKAGLLPVTKRLNGFSLLTTGTQGTISCSTDGKTITTTYGKKSL